MKSDLYWISGPAKGRIAIMPRPRGGDWLEDEVRAWKAAGVDIVLSLLTPDEIADLDLAQEEALCKAQSIVFLTFPIDDRGVPSSKEAVMKLAGDLASVVREGKTLAIHCRQGIGRAALMAICLLIRLGLDAETATHRVSAARGCGVPETLEQKRWILKFAEVAPFGEALTTLPLGEPTVR